jgi:hypothetical protein
MKRVPGSGPPHLETSTSTTDVTPSTRSEQSLPAQLNRPTTRWMTAVPSRMPALSSGTPVPPAAQRCQGQDRGIGRGYRERTPLSRTMRIVLVEPSTKPPRCESRSAADGSCPLSLAPTSACRNSPFDRGAGPVIRPVTYHGPGTAVESQQRIETRLALNFRWTKREAG